MFSFMKDTEKTWHVNCLDGDFTYEQLNALDSNLWDFISSDITDKEFAKKFIHKINWNIADKNIIISSEYMKNKNPISKTDVPQNATSEILIELETSKKQETPKLENSKKPETPKLENYKKPETLDSVDETFTMVNNEAKSEPDIPKPNPVQKPKKKEFILRGQRCLKVKPDENLPEITAHKHVPDPRVYRQRESDARDMINEKIKIMGNQTISHKCMPVSDRYMKYKTILPSKYFNTLDVVAVELKHMKYDLFDTCRYLDDYNQLRIIDAKFINLLNISTIKTIDELFCKGMLSFEETLKYMDVINIKSIMLSANRDLFDEYLVEYKKVCEETITKYLEDRDELTQDVLMKHVAGLNKKPEPKMKDHTEMFSERAFDWSNM